MKYKRFVQCKKFIVTLIALVAFVTSFAQIQGSVKDIQGESIVGASIIVKGSTIGSISDAEGNFSINTTAGKILEISSIGYNKTEMAASPGMVVILNDNAQQIDDVVVVGYGSQKKESLTGAVASVNVGETLDSRPTGDVARSLQGSVPGLTIQVGSGEIGTDPSIRIRGQVGSVQGSSAPLILLDNVEIPSLMYVNPDDIESISVLKDAASASIYGSKGAFGVILVTSKKGSKAHKITVSYSNNFAWQNPTKKIEMGDVDAMEYTVLAYERNPSANLPGTFNWAVTRDSWEKAKSWKEIYAKTVNPEDDYLYGRDWSYDGTYKYNYRTQDPAKLMIRQWAPSQQHNITVGGTGGKTTFNIGLGYFGQTGQMKQSKYDNYTRYNANLNISTEFNKYVTLKGSMMYAYTDKELPYITNSVTADPWLYIYRWGPMYPYGKQNGEWMRSTVSESAQANARNVTSSYSRIMMGGTINFIPTIWRLDADFTYAITNQADIRRGTRYSAYDSWLNAAEKLDGVFVNEKGEKVEAGTPGSIQAYQIPWNKYTASGVNPDHIYRNSIQSPSATTNIYTTFNKIFASVHDFKVMLGTNMYSYFSESNWSQKQTLLDISNPQFSLTSGTQTAGGLTYQNSQLGFFGRLNYAFDDKYLLEANLRYDGTSKFPTKLQWQWFPSFSVGWVVSHESFMQTLKPYLSMWKIRTSWGSIGDQSVPNTLYVSTMTQSNTSWLDGSTRLVEYGTPTPVSGAISWQRITTFDVGTDIRFFNSALGLTFDWYRRTTDAMIVPGQTVANTFGANTPNGNFGSLRTDGWEIAIDYKKTFSNQLTVSVMASLSDALSIVTKYQEGAVKTINTNGTTGWYNGKIWGEIWGYETDRLYTEDDFVKENGSLKLIDVPGTGKKAYQLKDGVYQTYLQNITNFYFMPGDVKYKDLDGSGTVDAGKNTVEEPGDRKRIGNTTPRYTYSFRLGFDWYGFDLSVLFQGVGKRELWGDGALVIPGYNSSDGAMSQAIAGNFWKEDRQDAFYPRPWNLAATAGGATAYGNTHPQTRYLLNMAYLRWKNFTFGYTLPTGLLDKIWVKRLRVYFSGENILTFDKLGQLPIDPEAIPSVSTFFDTSNYNSGRTGVGTPLFMSWSFGIQVTF